MDQDIQTVKEYYDQNAQMEWERLEQHPFEFIFTTYMLEKYIKPGDRVLDIGGGPGRYSIHFARRGCAVTLADLSEGNIDLAKERRRKRGCPSAPMPSTASTWTPSRPARSTTSC